MVARREPEAATTRPCQACARSHPLGLQPRPPQRRPQAPTHRSPRPKRKHRLASKVGLVTAPAVTRWLARHRALQLRRSARAWVSTLLPSTRAARILSSKIYAPHTVRPPFKMSASIESCRWFVFPFAGPSRNCSCEPNFSHTAGSHNICYIGLQYKSGKWVWNDGTKTDFTAWDGGQGTNGGNEPFGVIGNPWNSGKFECHSFALCCAAWSDC